MFAGRFILSCGAVFALVAAVSAAPYGEAVVSYVQGSGLGSYEASFNDPATALGAPERYSGEGTPYPGVVSVYSPPWTTAECVALGDGGHLTVRLGTPAINDASHPYGVDLLIFGNSAFRLADFSTLSTGTPAMLFGDGNGTIEVSADGITFYTVPGAIADRLFPTQGYNDSGAFDSIAGGSPANFFKPVNPSLSLSDFSARTYAQILAMYDGSGGGLPVDIGSAVDAFGQPAGLTSVSFVRISQTGEGDTEIDAFVVIPEPGTLTLLGLACACVLSRRRRGAAR